ncbi:hypothetical protein TSUD_315370 [Trifolium subterraneum]|uniref:Uncharacterized protein n=1 Tax=Trifolium subterraneum TaxID=3900 RepID=A0A2Z6NN89_TRISU|nr:hypothetical protein TSUD_315370 [Trifolium subterraneum]
MLMKKVDAPTKAVEVEWKKIKREAAAREKEGDERMLTNLYMEIAKANLLINCIL